ncbi:MAG: hypothetical protein Q8P56_00260 [Candidatus Uhrbacteria bacterium]|nr:hypothetical protein [Candidatus Uhrbacteria bacterium]
MARGNKFVVAFDEPSSYAFHAIALNYFVFEVLHKKDDRKSTQLYFRLFRTGLIGDILYKKADEYIESEEHTAEMELLAGLFESYMFLARSIYDYLLHFLREKYNVTDSSFSDFLKKVEKGNYPEIQGKFKDHLLNTKLFEEIRSLRDSIKRQTPYLFIYVKENRYWIDGTIYKRDGTKESFDDPLHTKIFAYTTALLLLMSYIAESATGKTLKEQLQYLEEKDKNKGSKVVQASVQT